jgi:hypothetical protein
MKTNIDGSFGNANHRVKFDEQNREGEVGFRHRYGSCSVDVEVKSASDCEKVAVVISSALQGQPRTEVKDDGKMVSASLVKDDNADEGVVIEIKNEDNQSVKVLIKDAKEAITVLDGVVRKINDA